MIKLEKVDEPAVLKENAQNWLDVIKDKISSGEIPTDGDKSKYRHADIKASLIVETNGKCAYCESFLRHISFGDVEHIHPKSANIDDIYRWDNLTLACDMCNTYKSAETNVIDPYSDDPVEHFKFFGPMLYAKPESPKAVVTEKKLKLNRDDLVKKRVERLAAISNIVHIISKTTDENVRRVIVDDLFENEIGGSTEYSAFAREFLLEIDKDANLRSAGPVI
ncbi:uncharacterized protein (TIGR02646 family) [Novosphingobium sp. PhB165]|uniref:HNH endonuclease n=1 Tax=Novosphingobium sp. PhB165 TaxID=2485105 RepID=UPI001049523E|nr:HNH endonuclease [Novosphingobium sp. PhB165]TCM18161.1 uncharacterized protein (TIGR02646 family) [Novosphingobium sp. PhB165]